MRLKKLTVVGAVAALLLLLCAAMIMDRKITEQQLKIMIATDTASQTNNFVISQPEEGELLPPVSTSYALSTSAEEVIVAEPAAESQTTTQPAVQGSFPTNGFLLKIRNTKISVGYDTSEEALKKRPGWLSTSAYPGEEGICIIYGHRNRKHLRALEKVKIGNEITIITEEEITYLYTICDTYVVDDLSEIVLISIDKPTLMLVTCYPFRYSGSAPQKYVVIAKQI